MAEGRITATVWPAHVGFGAPGEVLPHGRRSQIQWRVDEGGRIVGAAKPWVQAGSYDCLLYFHDLDGPPCGAAVFAHPHVQPYGDYVIVDPIVNNDPVQVSMDGVAR